MPRRPMIFLPHKTHIKIDLSFRGFPDHHLYSPTGILIAECVLVT